MTGPEHYVKGETLLAQADEWLDADYGWKANLSAEERIARRNSDLIAAQAEFAAAQVAATVEAASPAGQAPYAGMDGGDFYAWSKVVG